jgi:essential nuclear protein 1
MPRVQKSVQQRHDPLYAQLHVDETQTKYGRVSKPGKRTKRQKDEESTEVCIRQSCLLVTDQANVR